MEHRNAADELLPLFHQLVMAVIPRRIGDAECELLAAYAVVYQCAGTPEGYTLFARQCESHAGRLEITTEIAESYRQLAQLAYWRAALIQRGS
ncbi:MAG TPA: hypothetical protein PKA05_10860 [Roseiflexaceae bacterium]|nr:hypothetical protein [Roseiflexaceae bacterium]